MGGLGSGHRASAKRTVEQSFTVGISHFRKLIHFETSGTITCTWSNGNTSIIGFFLSSEDAGPVVTLHYRWQDAEDIRIPVRLQFTPTRFHGERWWFTCPLIVNGVACNRRIGKLHLPPGAKYFGCRLCHRLTYRSCQEAHQVERLAQSINRLASRMPTR